MRISRILCGRPHIAPGSSEILVSVSGVTKEKEPPLQSRAGPNGDPWAWHVEVFEQIVEALPRETAALTPAIEPLPQSTHGLVEELFQPIAVTRHSIVKPNGRGGTGKSMPPTAAFPAV